MQITSAAPADVIQKHKIIGLVDVKRASDPWLLQGERIGQKQGYASLGNALRALARLTDGPEAGAGFVTYADGRFHTGSVLTSKYRQNPGFDPKTYHLGETWDRERGIKMRAGVLAIVDGAKLVNNTKDTLLTEGAKLRRELLEF